MPPPQYQNVQTGTDPSGKAIFTSGVGAAPPSTTAVSSPSPISVSGLSSSAAPFQVPPPPQSSTPSIQDILGQFSAPSDAETAAGGAQSDTLARIGNLETALGQKSAVQTNLEQQGGVIAGQQQATDLKNMISSLTAQAGQAKLGSEDRLAPTFAITGEQAQIDRQLSMKTLGLSAALDAVNNNMALAENKVQRALSAQFDPITSQLDYYKQLLTINSENLSKAQAAKATALQAALQDRSVQVQQAYTQKQSAYTEMLKYAPFADANTLSKMQGASNSGEVAQIAAAAGIQAPQAGRYKDTITTTTDGYGNQQQTVRVFDTLTGQFVNAAHGTTAAQLNSGSSSSNGGLGTPSYGGAGMPSSGGSNNSNGLSFTQYGKLSNTNLNPSNQVDSLALQYLDKYIKDGTVPTNSTIGGRTLKPAAFAQIAARADELYTKATGSSLKGFNGQLASSYQDQLNGNNKLLNNLKVQEGTISLNASLYLNNLTSNKIDQNAPVINSWINDIRDKFAGDPNVAAAIAQNSTLSNELGALLALKNAQGTTVHDKLAAAGLIDKNATADQTKQVVIKLLQEASNAHSAIDSANADLYRQVDPLVQNPNNPQRAVEMAFQTQGGDYNHFISATPAGQIAVLDRASGTVGYIPQSEYDGVKYMKI